MCMRFVSLQRYIEQHNRENFSRRICWEENRAGQFESSWYWFNSVVCHGCRSSLPETCTQHIWTSIQAYGESTCQLPSLLVSWYDLVCFPAIVSSMSKALIFPWYFTFPYVSLWGNDHGIGVPEEEYPGSGRVDLGGCGLYSLGVLAVGRSRM